MERLVHYSVLSVVLKKLSILTWLDGLLWGLSLMVSSFYIFGWWILLNLKLWCFSQVFPIPLHPLTAGAWPAFILIHSHSVTKIDPAQICIKVLVWWQFSCYQIKLFVFIAVADLWTHLQTDTVVCTSQAQYPLIVGVVVAVATGLQRGCGPLAHGCCKAWRPLVVVWKKCISNHCWQSLETFVVQSKEEELFCDNHWIWDVTTELKII